MRKMTIDRMERKTMSTEGRRRPTGSSGKLLYGAKKRIGGRGKEDVVQ
jgi:hypothetical protein